MEIKNALIVDDDHVNVGVLKKILSGMGIHEVDDFSNGADAWTAIVNKSYDFLIIDWKSPQLPGVAIFNRLRRMGNYDLTPVLITSNVLMKKDFRLMEEYPGSDFVEKPFTHYKLEKKITSLMKEVDWYLQNKAMLDKLIDAVGNDGKKALKMLKDLFVKMPKPVPIMVMAGRAMYQSGSEKEAEQLFRWALEKDQNCIAAWNELGNIHYLKEKMEEAAKYYETAHKMSPKRFDRLIHMGDIELRNAEFGKAKDLFELAQDIDPQDGRAPLGIQAAMAAEQTHKGEREIRKFNTQKATRFFERALEHKDDFKKAQAGLKLAKNMDEFFEVHNKDEKDYSFASLLNIIGINKVKAAKIQEGLEQYRAALKFVSDDVDKSRLMFNMGLAYYRGKDLPKALGWFEKSAETGGNQFDKAQGYVENIKTKLKSPIDTTQFDYDDGPDVEFKDEFEKVG